jgi:hypothetical protein
MLYKLDRSQTPPKIIPVPPKDLTVDPRRRRVILFPGSGLDDSVISQSESGKKSIVGSFKYVEQALATARDQNEPIDIFLYTYEDSYRDAVDNQLNGMGSHYRKASETDANFMPSRYGRHAMRDFLRPMILAPGETFSTVSKEALKERLGTITLCAHSYGSIMSQHLADALVYELRQAGWQEKEITDTVKQVASVAVANIARVDYPQPNFTQYFFISSTDKEAMAHIKVHAAPEHYCQLLRDCGYPYVADIMERQGTTNVTPEALQEFRDDIISHRPKGRMPLPSIRPCASGYRLSALLPEDNVRWKEYTKDGHELPIRTLKEGDANLSTPVVHDFRTFLHGDHKTGEVLINVLNNAVMRERGRIGDGHTLLEPNELTRMQHHFRKVRHAEIIKDEHAVGVSERAHVQHSR